MHPAHFACPFRLERAQATEDAGKMGPREDDRECITTRPDPLNEFTTLLGAASSGDEQAANALLPLVYEELRRMAHAKMRKETPGQTLQPTALVHEAWLRLVDTDGQRFQNRRHFLAAASQAMRRILIERARRRQVLKKGGYANRVDDAIFDRLHTPPDEEVLAIHEALEELAAVDPEAANLVQLRYFGGLSMAEAATVTQQPLRSVERLWTFARTWLRSRLGR